ncbi:MAG: two-component system nitrogen regulation sensor histidine kinase NtrY [Bacteroidia bacterium]
MRIPSLAGESTTAHAIINGGIANSTSRHDFRIFVGLHSLDEPDNLKRALYIFLAALMVAIAALFLQRPSDSQEQASNRIEAFSESFQKLNALNQQVLEEVKSEDFSSSLTNHVTHWENYWSEDLSAILVYEKGQLIAWNTSAVPVRFHLDDRSKRMDGAIRLKNGLYLAKTEILEDGKSLVCLTTIRNEYPIHNRYLSDNWHPILKKTANLNPYLFEHAGSSPIEVEGQPVFYISASSLDNYSYHKSASLAWLVFFILLIWAIYSVRNSLSEVGHFSRALVVMFGLIITRAIMLIFSWPGPWYGLDIFDPIHHASNELIPSLGDLFLNMLVVLAIVREFAKYRLASSENKPNSSGWILTSVVTILMLLLVYPCALVFKLLVVNSSFSLDLTNPFGLDFFSLMALVVTAIMLFTVHLILRWVARWVSTIHTDIPTRSMVVLATSLVAILGARLLLPEAFWAVLAGSIVVGFQLIASEWQSRSRGFSTFTSNVLAYALLGCILLMHYQSSNEIEDRKTIARKIFSDEDPVAEFLFDEWREATQKDRKVKGLISVLPAHSEDLIAEIERRLQFEPWSRFNPTIHVFTNGGELAAHNAGQDEHGFSDLVKRIENSRPTHSDGLFYKGIVKGNGGYLARVVFRNPRSEEVLADVFIDLQPQMGEQHSGFPDLLLDSRFSQYNLLRPFSYARYVDNELIDHSGNYPFSLVATEFGEITSEFTMKEFAGNSHLMHRPAEGILIVLSRPVGDSLSYFTVFSYLFLLYFMVGAFNLVIRGSLGVPMIKNESFRNRINLAMISIITFTLLLVGLGTVMYVVEEYRTKNTDLVSEKSRSVQIEMEHKLRIRATLEPSDHDELSMLLTKFSKVFFTDINLYDLNGNLLATSQPKVFEEGLVSSRMDPVAFHEMKVNQRSEFIHDEHIGNLEFLTAYAPFRNEKRELMAYMSLPYFARQHGLEQEVVSLLAALTNIYVLLILLAVVLALFISNRITEPLRIIRENLRTLKLDKRNQAIEWESNDEIGELVKEYNRTLNELVKNAELLARSERESAWREMAKQVAHEIKNPLTPMKLHIQMLERSYKDGAEDLGDRIERTTKALVEQIDTLSNIATEFSSFAKMPKAEIEEVELRELLQSCTDLHQESEGTELLFNDQIGSPVLIHADGKQVLRVLNNLIKNAFQAIPENQEGRIGIKLERKDSQILVSVKDNGTGIPTEVQESIFVPNFTTKSSGMGLGLAMVKNIIEGMGGEIWFETKLDVGTTFYIRLDEA